MDAAPRAFPKFRSLVDAVSLMQQTQPNCAAQDLALIRVPVAIVQAEHDELVTLEHADYLARNIPSAKLIVLPGVSHVALLQRSAHEVHA
jgi:pimeloyl-ACP methyl ester carboxylesterase